VTAGEIVEVAVALALIVGGIWSYRRGGTQGPVLLFVIAAIMLIHGLGFLEYRPSAAELNR
jgi:hypothetical protein